MTSAGLRAPKSVFVVLKNLETLAPGFIISKPSTRLTKAECSLRRSMWFSSVFLCGSILVFNGFSLFCCFSLFFDVLCGSVWFHMVFDDFVWFYVVLNVFCWFRVVEGGFQVVFVNFKCVRVRFT